MALIFCIILGCGPTSGPSGQTPIDDLNNDLENTRPNPDWTRGGICSSLDFLNFKWPTPMFDFEKEGLQLALNISGSLEGPHGWKNLTNDFDGQGLSLGLMNQPLGTGSLQPLLIEMRDKHFAKFQSLFLADHFQSLQEMLADWEKSRVLRPTSDETFSPLDIDDGQNVSVRSSTAGSIDWARRTLYDSVGQFNPIWKQELLKLAGSPEYVAIQIQAAWNLHLRALALHHRMGVFELRTYLLMFDIVVQNGNLKPEDEIDYQNYVQQNAGASALQRLKKIVELRLRWVKPQFQNDVRLRKMSLINGGGLVHGKSRQYEKEYCFYRRQSFLRRPSLP